MKNAIHKKQFGLWDSPITPLSLSRGISFSGLDSDQSGTLVWLEERSGRGVLVVQPADGQAAYDLNSELSVRARVGYGGGDFSVSQGIVLFADSGSGRLYRQPLAQGGAVPITPSFGSAAAPALSPDGKWVMFVHSYQGQDCLAVVDAQGKFWPQKLASGADFYMQPSWHPASEWISWVEWDHPNMPWDGTRLKLARLTLTAGSLPEIKQEMTLAGGVAVSIFQPQFSPDGKFLAYAADPQNWWQLYLHELESGETRQLTFAAAEHGLAAWVQGMRTFTFRDDGRQIAFIRSQDGSTSLWQMDLESNQEERLTQVDEYTYLAQICSTPQGLALIASGADLPLCILMINLGVKQNPLPNRTVRRAVGDELPTSAYSKPQAVTWTGLDGGPVHGLFYSPQNERNEGIGKPPLMVMIHGGPTSHVTNAYNLRNQFFTSRGYAVLEVNYRGSTGYGREYRDRLRGNWGVLDVQDAVSGVRWLSDTGQVDSSRCVISGGSAGGFTVLKALEDYPGFFKAGICLFGVSNQFTLAAETHKFEAHYSDSLLGPLPEAAQVYRERSPIFFIDRIQDPMAIFQGDIDNVVPRSQSDDVVAALQRRGVPHVYHVYSGEGHGFRKAETIEHMYTAIDKFLRQYVIYA
jgi:dipeptidyl aminopeptidase/acylaminoacyl peptidase